MNQAMTAASTTATTAVQTTGATQAANGQDVPSPLTIDFCGERTSVTSPSFSIGRDADFIIDDDNRFIHRRFLELTWTGGVWCLTNVGHRLTVTVSAADGQLEAYLAPGATLPIVLARHSVWFTAGPTTYEFNIEYHEPALRPRLALDDATPGGDTTAGRIVFTPDQFRLIVALAEPTLINLDSARRGSRVPSSADAAVRLGWTITKFNRKLDNVCQRLAAQGIRGLHGEPGHLASDRRARLVEYAVAARIVGVSDVAILDTTPDTISDSIPDPVDGRDLDANEFEHVGGGETRCG